MNKILIATDSFKGSLSAPEACQIIATQARQRFPWAEVLELPIADGGEGLVEVVLQTLDGQLRTISVQDPLGRPIGAAYAVKTMIVYTLFEVIVYTFYRSNRFPSILGSPWIK